MQRATPLSVQLLPAYAALPSRAVVGGAPGTPPLGLRRCIRRACTDFLGALKRVQDFLSPHLFPQSVENRFRHFSNKYDPFVSRRFHGDDLSHGAGFCFTRNLKQSVFVLARQA